MNGKSVDNMGVGSHAKSPVISSVITLLSISGTTDSESAQSFALICFESNAKSAGIQIAKIITNYIGGTTMVDADVLGAGKNFTFKDFAILVRAGSQISNLEEILLYEGIPYRLIGEKSILENKVNRLCINLLRLKIDGLNNFRLFKIIETNYFGIPEKAIKDLKKKIIVKPEKKLAKELENLCKKTKNENALLLNKFLESSINGNDPPNKFFANYEFTFFKEKETILLSNFANKFPTIKSFLQNVLLGKEQDIEIDKENLNKLKDIEAISILTLHSAKGLEFPIVFIYEPVEGIMPYLEKDSDIHEERRLFYVGITRAKMKLFFIIPEKRKKYGQIVVTEPSRFIDEINEEWLNFNEVKFAPKFDKDIDQLTLF